MMSGVPLETCWSFNTLWNNKFYCKVVPCWLLLLIHTVLYFCRSGWCLFFHWLEENINSCWTQISCSSGMPSFPSTLHPSLEKRGYRERKWSNPTLAAVDYKTWDAKYMFYYICNFTLKTYLLTYLLTPWSRVLLEKLTVNFAASQEIPRTYGTRKFLTVPKSVSTWVILNIPFLRRGVVSTSPNSQAGGPPLVGCPRLLIQFIYIYPPYRRPFLLPQLTLKTTGIKSVQFRTMLTCLNLPHQLRMLLLLWHN
jgi:hypothetical protein